jgi:zinc transporter ZupT
MTAPTRTGAEAEAVAEPTTAKPVDERSTTGRAWLAIVLPVAALALLIGIVLATDPVRTLTTAPPTEALAFERVRLDEGEIELRVRNDGPEPVTIAQVLVNDAYWNHDISSRTLDRFEAATVDLAYPWEGGLPVRIALVSSTGLTFPHEIEAATPTPPFDSTTLLRYALIGVLVGVVPVAVGLLWLPALRRASAEVVRAVLAFTVGLLVALLVETTAEGLGLAAAAPRSLQGLEVFAGAALTVLAVMAAVDLAVKRRAASTVVGAGLATAYLVAAGIGLHNAGEGIAIGAAVATGQLALGSSLLVGFAVHNSTEGVAIASPLADGGGADGAAARSRPLPVLHLAALVAVAGLPTVVGAWAGGLAFSPLWAAAMFGLAAGAIAAVVLTLGRGLLRADPDTGRPGLTPLLALTFVLGLATMYVTGLLAA